MVEPVDRSKRIKAIDDHESNSNSASKLFMSIVIDDMLWEILVRLTHAKYAIRSSLACKRWHSLVRHPHFTADFSRQNRRRNDNSFHLFFRIGGRSWPRPEPFTYRILITETNNNNNNLYGHSFPSLTVRASSHDLIVVNKRSATGEPYLNNPLTKKWIKLRPPYPAVQMQEAAIGIIVLEPPGSGGYKFTAVLQGRHDHFVFDIFTFCSRTRAWTRSGFSTHPESLPAPLVLYAVQDAVSAGSVLCFPFERDFVFAGVLLFRPTATASFRFVTVPEGFRRGWRADRKRVLFGAVSGRLRVSQMLNRKGVFSLKIWELRYEYESESESESESMISWALAHDLRLRSGNNDKTKMFVAAFHPYNGDAVFVLRDCINICMYSNIGEEDKFERVSQLPISGLKLSNRDKDDMAIFVKVLPIFPTPWPTPV